MKAVICVSDKYSTFNDSHNLLSVLAFMGVSHWFSLLSLPVVVDICVFSWILNNNSYALLKVLLLFSHSPYNPNFEKRLVFGKKKKKKSLYMDMEVIVTLSRASCFQRTALQHLISSCLMHWYFKDLVSPSRWAALSRLHIFCQLECLN